MIKISETQSRFALSVMGGMLALILGSLGIIFGNDRVVKPDLKEYQEYVWENKVSREKMMDVVIKGDRSFRLTGFFFGDCILRREKNRHFICFNARNLNDLKWVRTQFPNLGIPLIVFSETAMDSMKAAALLRYYGYDAYMLDGGFRKFRSRYMTPVDFSTAKNPAEKKELERKKILYQFLTGKDDRVAKKALYDISTGGRKGISSGGGNASAAEEEEGC